MKNNIQKRIPKILRINRINKKALKISVLFSNGEDRVIDFKKVFSTDWKITENDPEFILLNPVEFAKVSIENYTLTWDNVAVYITGTDGKKKQLPYDIGADTLYDLSEPEELSLPIGSLLKNARRSLKLSQEDVAERSGTTRTYITRLENGKQDVEVMTLKKIVEAGLNKHLSISIV